MLVDEAMALFDNMQVDGLDACAVPRDGRQMNIRTPLVTLVAAAAIAGCNQKSHTIGGDADESVASAPVKLPPSISHSKIYRCADNRLVYVDWLSDNKSANIRTDKDGSPTQVTAAEEGGPLTAEGGYEIQGTGDAPSVRIAVPGHASQSCKA